MGPALTTDFEPSKPSAVAPESGRAHSSPSSEPAPSEMRWYESTLALALAGSLLMWAALPPLGWGMIGWLAPLPWLMVVQRSRLVGRRPYLKLYLAGFALWLMTLHWLRLPHPATSIGWVALSAYLACYVPLFVGLSRLAIHQFTVPLWIAAPVVWTGLELARAHLFTGFLMAALGHTQVRYPWIIQISDLVGAYGVSFLVMLVASCLVTVLWRSGSANKRDWRHKVVAGVVAAAALIVTTGYGQYRLQQFDSLAAQESAGRRPRIAIVQGNSLATWKHEPDKQQKIMAEYVALSNRAIDKARQLDDQQPVDLLIWPETMFRTSLVTAEEGVTLPNEAGTSLEAWKSYGPSELKALAVHLDTALLVGIDRRHVLNTSAPDDSGLPAMKAYNSSVLVDVDGSILTTYDKMHRVMFGEYVPLVNWVPLFDRIAALTGGVDAGAGPVAMQLGGVTYAPNICYESVIPHVIRRQFVALASKGQRPDVLVNLTNDAWYWGSSELDMHIACDMLRSVECRRPMVVAANGGLSASIDSCGRLIEQSPRQAQDVIITDVQLDARTSPYMATGDWFAGICLLCCVGCAVAGWPALRRKP